MSQDKSNPHIGSTLESLYEEPGKPGPDGGDPNCAAKDLHALIRHALKMLLVIGDATGFRFHNRPIKWLRERVAEADSDGPTTYPLLRAIAALREALANEPLGEWAPFPDTNHCGTGARLTVDGVTATAWDDGAWSVYTGPQGQREWLHAGDAFDAETARACCDAGIRYELAKRGKL